MPVLERGLVTVHVVAEVRQIRDPGSNGALIDEVVPVTVFPRLLARIADDVGAQLFAAALFRGRTPAVTVLVDGHVVTAEVAVDLARLGETDAL
jgi:hypothetical protein